MDSDPSIGEIISDTKAALSKTRIRFLDIKIPIILIRSIYMAIYRNLFFIFISLSVFIYCFSDLSEKISKLYCENIQVQEVLRTIPVQSSLENALLLSPAVQYFRKLPTEPTSDFTFDLVKWYQGLPLTSQIFVDLGDYRNVFTLKDAESVLRNEQEMLSATCSAKKDPMTFAFATMIAVLQGLIIFVILRQLRYLFGGPTPKGLSH